MSTESSVATRSHPKGSDPFAAIILAVAGLVLQGIAPFAPGAPDSPLRAALQGLGWCAWAGAAGFAARGWKLPTPTAKPRAGGSAGRAGLGIACAVAWGTLLRATESGNVDATETAMHSAVQAWPLGVSIVAYVLLPAVGEEAFFRGTPLRLAAHRFGPMAAGTGSALLFGACHPANPVAAMLFGGALAALALATGRAREAMTAHALHNALGLWWLL